LVSLTTEQVHLLLDSDIDTAILIAETLFEKFPTLSLARQIILVDMAFNLGQTRLSEFVKHQCINVNGNWVRAASEMQNSLWAASWKKSCFKYME
jgi:lysozyme